VQVVKLHSENRLDEALPLAKRVVEIREAALGPRHRLLADALCNLGAVLLGKRKYDDAEQAYKRALAIYEDAAGPQSLATADTLSQLAWLRAYFGDHGKAEDYFKRALAIREKLSGADSIEVAQVLGHLASFYQGIGKYAKAVSTFQRLIAIKEKRLDSSNEELADLLDKCACAMKQNRQGEEATTYEMRAHLLRSDPTANPKDVPRRMGGVIQGKATYRQAPVYPPAAKAARVVGAIVIEVTVDEAGRVVDARVKCGPDIFAAAALEAARKWRFTPTLVNGVPLKVLGTITFNFTR
jgi:TonB family protein